jgi:hypothetical protein
MRATGMLILVPLVLSIPQPVAALAQAKPVSVGNTVRLTLQGNPVPTEGTLFDVTPEEWRLSLQNGEYRSFDPASVTAVEVWTTRRNVLQGKLIGAGAGLVAAFATAGGDSCKAGGPITTLPSTSARSSTASRLGHTSRKKTPDAAASVNTA